MRVPSGTKALEETLCCKDPFPESDPVYIGEPMFDEKDASFFPPNPLFGVCPFAFVSNAIIRTFR